MEYIRNFLILFAIVVNSYTFCMEPHCMEPQGLSPYFIAQDSRISTVPLTGAFGEFLSEIPVVQYTSLKEGGSCSIQFNDCSADFDKFTK